MIFRDNLDADGDDDDDDDDGDDDGDDDDDHGNHNELIWLKLAQLEVRYNLIAMTNIPHFLQC